MGNLLLLTGILSILSPHLPQNLSLLPLALPWVLLLFSQDMLLPSILAERVLGLVLWILLSTSFSQQPWVSAIPAFRTLSLLLVLLLCCTAWRPQDLRRWSVFRTGGSILLSLVLMFDPQSWRVLGVNPNYAAAFLASSLCWSLGRYFFTQSRFHLLAALLLGLGMLQIHSRGAWIGLAIGISSLAWGKGKRPALWVCLLLLFAAATLPLSTWIRLSKLEDPVSFHRTEIWKSALAISLEHPLSGVGPGNFESSYFRHNFPVEQGLARFQKYAGHAHSEPLQIASEMGWPALAFSLWLLAYFLLPLPSRSDRSLWPAWSASLCLLIHSCLDGILNSVWLNLLLVGYLAEILLHHSSEKSTNGAVPASHGLLLGGTGIVSLGLILILQPDPTLLPEALRRSPQDFFLRLQAARSHLFSSPPEIGEALLELKQARSLCPSCALPWVQEAEIHKNLG